MKMPAAVSIPLTLVTVSLALTFWNHLRARRIQRELQQIHPRENSRLHGVPPNFLNLPKATPWEMGQSVIRDRWVVARELPLFEESVYDKTFHNCLIEGPTIFVVTGARFEQVFFGYNRTLNSILWPFPPKTDVVVGTVGLIRCKFYGGGFVGCGFAGEPEQLLKMRAGMGSTSGGLKIYGMGDYSNN